MYLQETGAEVDAREEPNLATLRERAGVPAEAASCHTALVGGYVVDGHVPVGALIALLERRSQAVGIAVAGMPADATGMSGN